LNADKAGQELEITDQGNIELVLRMLQYMCEGYNMECKAYLREQTDNIRSIDLVSETVEFLRTTIEEIAEDNIELISQTVETLVEVCQGSAENQEVIFMAHVVDHVNYLLRLPSFGDCTDLSVAILKQSCAKLLLTLMENNDDRTKDMAKQLAETLSIRDVNRAMEYYFMVHEEEEDERWKNDLGADDDEDDLVAALDVSYSFYEVMLRLSEFLGQRYWEQPAFFSEYAERKEDKKGDIRTTAGLYFDKHTASIEIQREGQLHSVYFLNKWKSDVHDSTKDKLIWTVNRVSPTDKVGDFVMKCGVIIADTKLQRRIRKLSWLTTTLLKYPTTWTDGLHIVTIVLNILMLVVWRSPRTSFDGKSGDKYRYAPDLESEKYPAYEPVFQALGIIHILCSFAVTVVFFLVSPPSLQASVNDLPIILLLKRVFPKVRKLLRYLPQDASNRTPHSLFAPIAFYHFMLLPLSVLAYSYFGYFYCWHLLHIVVGNDILMRVIQAVTKNGSSLLWVAALLCIIIYIYTFISFALLRDQFDRDEGYWCDTLFQCFVTSLKFGLLNGGGLGEGLTAPNDDFWRFFWRTVFDLSFFVMISIIGLNVVFGIIVDTFSQLRDEKYQIEDAMESECFICSLKSYDFERFGNGFKKHIKDEHNMWNYLYFLMHLEEKDPNDYTSHEFYVQQLLKRKEEVQFFPINKSLVLLQHHRDRESTEKVLSQQTDMLESIGETMEAVVMQLADIERRLAGHN
jgi:inositol 1,4,5-triphosphate receptor type 1